MKVQIYGLGCARCNMLLENVRAAVRETGADAEIIKIEDAQQMIESGILAMPGLAIDGMIKSVGRVPSTEEIKKWIKEKSEWSPWKKSVPADLTSQTCRAGHRPGTSGSVKSFVQSAIKCSIPISRTRLVVSSAKKTAANDSAIHLKANIGR
jgi:small redox-active disulfide protein 2